MTSNIITISSSKLKIEINRLGAELFSIINIESGRECLWQGDPAYWRSRSPILFPIVGALNNNTLHQGGKEYTMTQHGFARAMEFEVVKHNQDEVIFCLETSAESLEKYPYEFKLEIGYRVSEERIDVSYSVMNPSKEMIYFQLGAHPGFNYIDYNPNAEVQGYLTFDDREGRGEILSGIIDDKGLLIERTKSLKLNEKMIDITKNLFDEGALIIENDQVEEISLLESNKEPYVRVKFKAPVVGVWSSGKGGYAPFVCIEPWFGRCDKVGYEGEFTQKDWMQSLEANSTFETGFSIWITK